MISITIGIPVAAQDVEGVQARIRGKPAATVTKEKTGGSATLLISSPGLGAPQTLAALGSEFLAFDLDGRTVHLGVVDLNHDGSDELVVRTAVPPHAAALHVLRRDARSGRYKPVPFAGQPWLTLADSTTASVTSAGRIQLWETGSAGEGAIPMQVIRVWEWQRGNFVVRKLVPTPPQACAACPALSRAEQALLQLPPPLPPRSAEAYMEGLFKAMDLAQSGLQALLASGRPLGGGERRIALEFLATVALYDYRHNVVAGSLDAVRPHADRLIAETRRLERNGTWTPLKARDVRIALAVPEGEAREGNGGRIGRP